MRILLVGLAGAAGALCRYGVGAMVGVRSFPWATLGINVSGSLALGVLLAAGAGRLSADAIAVLAVGFLGAFTTFSAFSYEAQTLLRSGRLLTASTYVVVSVVAGVGAAAAGYALGRTLA